MRNGRIVLLNGASSSGKTTIAQSIAEAMPDFFHFSIDDFDHVIEKMEDRAKGKLIPIETELFFHRTIRIFSDQGVNIIADHVLINEASKRDFFETLSTYSVLCIGVKCPLKVLMERERERGDRTIGLAQAQYEVVHTNMRYDLEIDTNDVPIGENVGKIIAMIKKST